MHQVSLSGVKAVSSKRWRRVKIWGGVVVELYEGVQIAGLEGGDKGGGG